jgi:PKD repeat protein
MALEDLITGTITPLNGALSYDFSLNADANPDAPRFRLRTVVPEAAFIAPTTVEVNTRSCSTTRAQTASATPGTSAMATPARHRAPTHTYTIGGSFEVSLTATTGNCSSITTRTVEVSSPALPLRAKVMLQGAYDAISGLMRDDLRLAGLLPIVEPYTALGYTLDNSGANTSPAALAHIGNDAYVDWVTRGIAQQR